MSNTELVFNDEWIREFELKPFHETPVRSLKVHCLYCDSANTLIHSKTEVLVLSTPTELSGSELTAYLANQTTHNATDYVVDDVLKYIVNLGFEDVYDYVNEPTDAAYPNARGFLKRVPYPPAEGIIIPLFPTIEMFQNLNCLYVFLKEAAPPEAPQLPIPAAVKAKKLKHFLTRKRKQTPVTKRKTKRNPKTKPTTPTSS